MPGRRGRRTSDGGNDDGAEDALRRLIELSTEASGQWHRFRYVNPVLAEDSFRVVCASAQRILEYERYLDYLETIKTRTGRLPVRIEGSVGRSIQGIFQDVQAFSAAALDLASETENAAVFHQVIPEFARMLDGSGPIRATELLARVRPALADLCEPYGLSRELIDWTLQYVDLGGMELSTRDGRVYRRGVEPELFLVPENPAPLRIADGAWFAYGQGFERYVEDPRAFEDGVGIVSPYGSVILKLRALLRNYQERAFLTARDGVQVYPGGVWGIIILIVIGIIIFVAGVILSVRCHQGKTTGDICYLAGPMMFVGLIIICIATGACTISNGEEEAPFPDDPQG